jgi:hypothetical protein
MLSAGKYGVRRQGEVGKNPYEEKRTVHFEGACFLRHQAREKRSLSVFSDSSAPSIVM